MKTRRWRLAYFWLGLGVILAIFMTSICIELFRLPQNLTLAPGQQITLWVHFPLGFHSSDESRNFQAMEASPPPTILRKRIVLSSEAADEFDVQLRILGAIPVKNMHVRFKSPPMVVPGGQAIGVLFSSYGVVIVGHLPVRGIDGKLHYPAKDAGLEIGDIILRLNHVPINRVEDMELVLKNYQPQMKSLELTVKRRDEVKMVNIQPVLCVKEKSKEFRFMLGIFIEDPAAGVGTLTFYDPLTKRFAGLGHRIADFPGVKGLSFHRGEIVFASIHGIKPGAPGEPGEKIGICSSNSGIIGRIERNTRFGIYGRLMNSFNEPFADPIPIAYSSQIKEGPAEIYTVIKGRTVEKFTIEIMKVFRQNEPRDKGMIIKVTDPALLKQTGGIIQGMSGSPIIQKGRLVGAVTHVFVNDPTKGYGVLAEWMNNEINYSPIRSRPSSLIRDHSSRKKAKAS